MIRVAIALERGGDQWLGGINYFRNLLYAVNSRSDRRVEIVLLAGERVDLRGLEDLAETIRTPLLDIGAPKRTARKILQRLTKNDWLLGSLLKTHHVKLLTHSDYLGRFAGLPSMPWIPDFQHVYLPHLFPRSALERRVHTFSDYARYGSCVLLSSRSAEKDLFDAVKPLRPKTHVLRFASCLAIDIAWPGKGDIMTRYELGKRWFHLPNQFWAHKNHELVIKSLEIARDLGNEFTVIATGNTEDARNPSFFQSIKKRIAAADLERQFIIAGMIPYDDLLALMRYSVAVINPSRFEGWSTSVEEGRSLGKCLLMSDIDVHREQAPTRGRYFGVDSPESLAKLMVEVDLDHDDDREEAYVKAALGRLSERREEFANSYEEIVFDVLRMGEIPSGE